MNIDLFDEIIKSHHQYSDSDLWKAIQQATGCTELEAKSAARVHCNSLSFYALCRARGFIMFGYSTWIEKLTEAGILNPLTGWLSGSKLKIAELFGFKDEFNDLRYYINYDRFVNAIGLDPEKGYNIKIYNNHNKDNLPGKGDHFMGGYILDGKMYISDSSNRGIRVEMKSVIPREKFQWGMPV